jgi:N-acetylmuramoyl-L-alanine amidase
MKILIDNGHGIDTPGKRSPDGVLREYACFIRIRRE